MSSSNVKMGEDEWLDARQAADFLHKSTKRMATLRTNGTGPPFYKDGKIFYKKSDLVAWREAGAATSTAQARLSKKNRANPMNQTGTRYTKNYKKNKTNGYPDCFQSCHEV